jgi:hypothetical protein
MPIHDCAHTFADLATAVLPAHMAEMHKALANPVAMANFSRPGVGAKSILREQGLARDFSGCYSLVEGNRAIYVGISRNVFSRLRQHVFGKTHFDASLAFRIAASKHPDAAVTELSRAEAMLDDAFGATFAEAQEYLQSLKVAYIEIQNPLELYVFEPYCAIELDTHQWNSFETH